MKDDFNPPWRLMAATLYKAPRDSKVFGSIEADVTEIDEYIKAQRRAGNKLTMTHFVTAALARSLARYPEINCFIRRGKLVPRDYVDVMLSVGIKGATEMTAVKIRDAHTKSVTAIAEEIRQKTSEVRQGDENKTMRNKYTLTKFPWPLRIWVFNFVRWMLHDAGINLGFMGYKDSSFGSIILTNIGTLGLTTGFPALMPAAQIPAVISMGKCELKPVIHEKEIVARMILPMSGTFDHRIVDGVHMGKLVRTIRRMLSNPELLDSEPQD